MFPPASIWISFFSWNNSQSKTKFIHNNKNFHKKDLKNIKKNLHLSNLTTKKKNKKIKYDNIFILIHLYFAAAGWKRTSSVIFSLFLFVFQCCWIWCFYVTLWEYYCWSWKHQHRSRITIDHPGPSSKHSSIIMKMLLHPSPVITFGYFFIPEPPSFCFRCWVCSTC